MELDAPFAAYGGGKNDQFFYFRKLSVFPIEGKD